jgi:hypothetical protein
MGQEQLSLVIANASKKTCSVNNNSFITLSSTRLLPDNLQSLGSQTVIPYRRSDAGQNRFLTFLSGTTWAITMTGGKVANKGNNVIAYPSI